jgi:16S rRNA (guanine527-N7)-methyltransferase
VSRSSAQRTIDPGRGAAPPELTGEQRQQLTEYRDLIIAWNRRFNLTAITEAEAVDLLLIAESLRLLPAIDDFASTLDTFRLVDLGTGAGIPGIPLAIARPEWAVTLIEATGKKVSFLNQVIDHLSLRNVTAVHGRAEEIARDLDHRVQYDAATARAVSSLPTLLELSLPFLRTGGRGFFPKGLEIDQELTDARRAAPKLGGKVVSSNLLSENDNTRVTRLVIIDKIDATPERYPRRAGIPAKEPLGRVER